MRVIAKPAQRRHYVVNGLCLVEIEHAQNVLDYYDSRPKCPHKSYYFRVKEIPRVPDTPSSCKGETLTGRPCGYQVDLPSAKSLLEPARIDFSDVSNN